MVSSGFCFALLEGKICSGCFRVCFAASMSLKTKKYRIAFYLLLNFLLPSWTTAQAVKLAVLDTTGLWSCSKTPVFFLPFTCDSSRTELSSGSQKCKHPLVSSDWWQWKAWVFSSAFCVSLLYPMIILEGVKSVTRFLVRKLSSLRFDLFSVWESHYFLPELWCNK